MMMDFPLHFEPDDNGTLLVTCPTLPEVTTFAESRSEALQHGREAIEEALAARLARWEDTKIPSRDDLLSAYAAGSTTRISLLADMKLSLMVACKMADVSRAELARRLNWHREQVDRLFRLDHNTRVDQFDEAFDALGQRYSGREQSAA